MGTLLCREDSENSHRLSTMKSLDSSNCSTSRRPSSPNPNPQQNLLLFDQLCFDSRFESGNLQHAEKAGTNEYNLWIAPDCYRTQEETRYKVWFYFSVVNVEFHEENPTFTFRIKNMSKTMHHNYLNGMVPVYSSTTTNHEWRYLPTPLKDLNLIKNTLEVTFEYKFTPQDTEGPVFFAFSFPYTYTKCEEYFTRLEKEYSNDPDIYYKRELLTYSLEGRNIDLVTITAHDPSIFTNHSCPELEPHLEGLFPSQTLNESPSLANNEGNIIKRPFIFRKKKYILITCRGRPAETPSSFLLEGLLNALLNKSDCVSRALLEDFVFVIVPMLNPDGVWKGHYRTDTKGNDLDKVFPLAIDENNSPNNFHNYPSVSALVSVVKSLSDGRLVMYLDLHTGSSKEAGFLIGNHQDDIMGQTDARLFAALLDVYSKVFDIKGCAYTKVNTTDKRKAGDGKTEIGKLTGVVHCYKLCTGYYKGTKDPERYSQENTERDLLREVEGVLDVKAYEEVGREIRHVLLEMFTEHPMSKVSRTWYGSAQGLKNIIYDALMKREELRKGNMLNEEGSLLDLLKQEIMLYGEKK